jgi:hypothetical protein
MNPRQIRQHLRREPFRPLRFHLSDGSHYEVYHPEKALVTRTELAIALGAAPEDVPESMVYCDPLHITRIEPVDRRDRKRSAKK